MYGFLWRHIPGSWPVKLTVFGAGIFGIVLLLFQVAFPAAEPHLPWSKDTVGNTTVQQKVVGDYGPGPTPSNGVGSTPSAGTSSTPTTGPASTSVAASPSALPGD
jgi:hypothetical protein